MPLSDYFSSSKKKPKADSDTSPKSSPRPSPRTSPTKSKPSQSTFGSFLGPNPNSPRKSYSRSSSNRSSLTDTHPLNLPPLERERRRSAMSAGMEEQTPEPMNIDPEFKGVNGNANHVQTNGNTTPSPPSSQSPETAARPLIDAEACKALGNKYFKAKDYDKAITEYTKALSVDPNAVTYLSNRAAAYMTAHRYQEALDDSLRAATIDTTNAKVSFRLARIYTSLGRPSEALKVLDDIPSITLVPPQDRAAPLAMQNHIEQAESAIREGTSGSMALHALDQAERGLGFSIERPRKWVLLRGAAYLKMGNVNALGQAQDVAMTLLRRNSKDPEALVLRGRALCAQGDNTKAIQHFKEALNCDPDFKDAVKYLRMVQKMDRMKEEGNAFYKSGRNREAVDVYTQALTVDPTNKGTNSKILHNRALASIKLKEYQSAIDDCNRALTMDPSYTKACKTKARALGESGDWETAVREYKAIQENHPEEPGLANDIRHAELELKKSKRKDHYKILGIEKDATDNDIKKAYRKLAIVHHPDKNPGDETAAERFKDIGEAYETLSDPQKRARFDSGEDLIDPSEMFAQQGGMGGFPMGGGMGGGMQIDPEILFNMMGGGGGTGPGGGGFSFSTGGGGNPFGAAGGMPFGAGAGASAGSRRRGGGGGGGFGGFSGF